ncbi:MAG TPA: phosphoribosylglycinamide synthetase C domain-containing protein, partial [Trueperaceae bacterium]|nr:phosphoribosylglycinamide synthetase C domain-containing protein [Trueperaceae bacterium]
LLTSDAGELFAAVADGRLAEITTRWREGAAACVVLAAPGYPAAPVRGIEIGVPGNVPDDVLVFHAGTRAVDSSGRDAAGGTRSEAAAGAASPAARATAPGRRRYLTNGGRVLDIVALGLDVPSAVAKAYEAVESVDFPGVVMRGDIGGGID